MCLNVVGCMKTPLSFQLSISINTVITQRDVVLVIGHWCMDAAAIITLARYLLESPDIYSTPKGFIALLFACPITINWLGSIREIVILHHLKQLILDHHIMMIVNFSLTGLTIRSIVCT